MKAAFPLRATPSGHWNAANSAQSFNGYLLLANRHMGFP